MALNGADSTAHKRARRQFNKTTKNRPQDFGTDWSPFRSVEKRYKAYFPSPDLSAVLDLATLDPNREDEINRGVWRGNPNAFEFNEIYVKNSSGKKAFVIPRIPGLVILPSFVNANLQRELVQWALCKHSRDNETNLHVHYHLPEEGLWNSHLNFRQGLCTETIIQPKASAFGERPPPGPRQLVNNTEATSETLDQILSMPKPPPASAVTLNPVSISSLIYKLRWANIGWFYHWGTKQYDFTKPRAPVDSIVRDLCRSAVDMVDWDKVFQGTEDKWGNVGPEWKTWDQTYEPDAGIVNFYQARDTLMGHVDRSEVCATSPLVSISLGNAAIFLIGGKTRDVEPISLILRSGDVIVMSGPECRRAYHGVPRILEGTLPSHFRSENAKEHDWLVYEEYMKTTRININVRQVFPKDFSPPTIA